MWKLDHHPRSPSSPQPRNPGFPCRSIERCPSLLEHQMENGSGWRIQFFHSENFQLFLNRLDFHAFFCKKKEILRGDFIVIFPKSQNFSTAFFVESNPLSMGWSPFDPTKKGLNSSPLKAIFTSKETAIFWDNGEFSVEVDILTCKSPIDWGANLEFLQKTKSLVPKKNRHLSWSAHAFLKFHTPNHHVALGWYIEASIMSQAPSFLNIITDGIDSLMLIFSCFLLRNTSERSTLSGDQHGNVIHAFEYEIHLQIHGLWTCHRNNTLFGICIRWG